MRSVLQEAAGALEHGSVQAGGAAAALLDSLGYVPGDAAADGGNRAALLRVAARLDRLFALEVPTAPGLACFGGQLRGPGWLLNASGVGTAAGKAFENCVGEASEFLSQLEREADIARRSSLADVAGRLAAGEAAAVGEALRDADVAADAPLDWVAGHVLADGRKVLIPADRVLRREAVRRALPADGPMSLGCGAGPALATAITHGLHEAIERDAAALWWRGGVRGHALPFDAAIQVELLQTAALLRGGVDERITWFIDITTDLEFPCVAAISSGRDGFGFSCGMGARPTLAAAARAALIELCQMELSGLLIAARLRSQGSDGLSAADRDALHRLTAIDTRDNPLLHPLPHPRRGRDAPAAANADLAGWLHALGYEACVATLTRADIGIPAALVRIPGLEREPSGRSGRRLRETIAKTGGGGIFTGGVSLI
jgi:ribosomal protein S12 methylthiotransferase accessory factor